jgi:hypothetical protein
MLHEIAHAGQAVVVVTDAALNNARIAFASVRCGLCLR